MSNKMGLLFFLLLFSYSKVYVINASNVSDSDSENPYEIRRLLEFYSSEKLADNFERVRELISTNCSEDLNVYLDALKHGEKWALKSKSIYLFFLKI